MSRRTVEPRIPQHRFTAAADEPEAHDGRKVCSSCGKLGRPGDFQHPDDARPLQVVELPDPPEGAAELDARILGEAVERPTPVRLPTQPCRSCGQPIVWCISYTTGTHVPVDPHPVAGGNVRLDVSGGTRLAATLLKFETIGRKDLHTNHFATCPHATKWRRGRGAGR